MPSAHAEVTELKCIVGKTVTFPTAVKKTGLFIKNESTVARVDRIFYITNKNILRDRVHWNGGTGSFYITDLKTEDSGNYRVVDTDKKSDFIYQLTVYNSVSTPEVSNRNKMKPTCSVLCSVENGREVTLSWQREGETLYIASRPDSNTPLSLPLEIEECNSTYSCVATNPVSEERSFFSMSELCRVECNGHSDQSEEKIADVHPFSVHRVVLYVMFVLRLVEFVLVTLAVGLLIHLYREGRVQTQHSMERREKRKYSDL
ncbi:signaling lymphocytic activation molecule-like [Megalops cyprinoides]|uniref:signaling lymphocytic activation molecule-like n=1 Tax=Megalops cyprinoides TaxID=118141 RepID=UPI0018645AF7|nr:signaling lymphocytic activation molecule-like [Megalops cyprinoides]